MAFAAPRVPLSGAARGRFGGDLSVLLLGIYRRRGESALAKKMAASCEVKAKEMGWKMNISVVDSGANEIFFEKMDGAYLGSRDIALHKAQTSARFPFTTRFME